MDSGIKRTQRDYTLAFKLSVVDQIEKGELTYKEAQQCYGIQGHSQLLKHCIHKLGASLAIPPRLSEILARPETIGG